jgi:6-phosphofructokinase
MAKSIGILTAGGDSPGLNAAIRAIEKSAIRDHGRNVIGFIDGFRGLMQNRYVRLDSDSLSGMVTRAEQFWEPDATRSTRWTSAENPWTCAA